MNLMFAFGISIILISVLLIRIPVKMSYTDLDFMIALILFGLVCIIVATALTIS